MKPAGDFITSQYGNRRYDDADSDTRLYDHQSQNDANTSDEPQSTKLRAKVFH